MNRAATGSAHHQPHQEFASSAASVAAARAEEARVSIASPRSALLDNPVATRYFRRPSQGSTSREVADTITPNAEASGCECPTSVRPASTPTYKATAATAKATPYCARRSKRSAPTGSRLSLENRHTRTTEADESSSALREKPARAGLLSITEMTSANAPTTPLHAMVKNESRSAEVRSAARSGDSNAAESLDRC